MKTERLNKKKSIALVGGILLILTIPAFGLRVQIQALLFLAWIYAVVFLEACRYPWKKVQEAMAKSCAKAVSPICFLLCAGAMTGIWNLSGTIPGMTYAGIMWIRPEWYPVAAFAACFCFSLVTGSVFSSCGTVGLLFLGIGQKMGYGDTISVFIVSAGAFLGYGLSPMADFVNLLSSMTGISVKRTLKSECWAVIPAILICVLVCIWMGQKNMASKLSPVKMAEEWMQLLDTIRMGVPVYIPVIVLLGVIAVRKPAIQALMAGSISGMLTAFFYQKYPWKVIFDVLWSGPDKEAYFHGGGISSMAGTVILFLLAFSLFGMLEACGAVENLMEALFSWADTPEKGEVAAVLLGFVLNLFSASAMCSLIVSLSCLMPVYRERGWKKESMVRAAFMGSLYASLLIPWHSNVITPQGLLGISQGEMSFWMVPGLVLVCYLLTFVFSYK